MSLQSTFLGVNDSVFTNVNKFQSITNFLDLFCDWLCVAHMIHFELCRVHLNAFCINDATSCNIWKFKLFLSNSSWKELPNGIWFAYICQLSGLALKIGVDIQNLRGLKSRLRLWHENPNGGVLFVNTSKQNKNISASLYWDKCSRWIHQRLQGFFSFTGDNAKKAAFYRLIRISLFNKIG